MQVFTCFLTGISVDSFRFDLLFAMAKHPVPHQKTCKSRSKTRHSAFEKITRKKLTDVAKTVKCENCGSMKRPHYVCETCGMYRGRQVIEFKMPSEKKDVQKIKV